MFCCALEISVKLFLSSDFPLTCECCGIRKTDRERERRRGEREIQSMHSDISISTAVPSTMRDAKEEGSWQIMVTLNSSEHRIPVPTKA